MPPAASDVRPRNKVHVWYIVFDVHIALKTPWFQLTSAMISRLFSSKDSQALKSFSACNSSTDPRTTNLNQYLTVIELCDLLYSTQYGLIKSSEALIMNT